MKDNRVLSMRETLTDMCVISGMMFKKSELNYVRRGLVHSMNNPGEYDFVKIEENDKFDIVGDVPISRPNPRRRSKKSKVRMIK